MTIREDLKTPCEISEVKASQKDMQQKMQGSPKGQPDISSKYSMQEWANHTTWSDFFNMAKRGGKEGLRRRA